MTAARVAALAAVVALALAAPSLAARVLAKPKALEDFLPRRLAGVELKSLPMGFGRALGLYALPDANGGDPRHVTITLDIELDAAEYVAIVVHKAGETKDSSGGVYEGLRVGGRLVQRRCEPAGNACQVDVLIAKRLLVNLRVERPVDRDEALRFFGQLDIKGMEAFVPKYRRPEVEPPDMRLSQRAGE